MPFLADPFAGTRLRIPQISRLGWLMGLYAENFRHFDALFGASALAPGEYRSSVDDGRDVCLDVLEHHPYTSVLRLTYADILDPVSGEPDPSAYLRLYHDSHQLEATHYHIRHHWQSQARHQPIATILEHRLHMNTFLGKWLTYLRDCGHRRGTLQSNSAKRHLPAMR